MSFHGALGTSIAAYMLATPWFGRARYQRLRQELRDGGQRVRERFYVRSMLSKGIVTVVASFWLATAPWRLPFSLPWATWSTTVTWLLGSTIAIGISTLAYRRWGDRQLRFLLKTASGIVPRTQRERRFFYGVCVSAGLTEEMMYRWFLTTYLMSACGLGLWASAAVGSALFGIAHLYQGIWGVLLTGVLGYAFVSFWFSSGTLLTAMVVHALVDLRINFVLWPERIEKLEGDGPLRRS